MKISVNSVLGVLAATLSVTSIIVYASAPETVAFYALGATSVATVAAAVFYPKKSAQSHLHEAADLERGDNIPLIESPERQAEAEITPRNETRISQNQTENEITPHNENETALPTSSPENSGSTSNLANNSVDSRNL